MFYITLLSMRCCESEIFLVMFIIIIGISFSPDDDRSSFEAFTMYYCVLVPYFLIRNFYSFGAISNQTTKLSAFLKRSAFLWVFYFSLILSEFQRCNVSFWIQKDKHNAQDTPGSPS